MLPTLQFGPLALPVPAMLFLAGLWVALSLSERAAARAAIPQNEFYILVLLSLGAGLLTGRLSYIIQYPSAFGASPISLFSINPNLFDLLAAVAGALLAALSFSQRRAIPLWTTMDILTPGLGVMGIVLGLSHIASGAAFGEPTQLPWGIHLWGEKRHPAQFYETLLAGLVLGAIMFLQKKPAFRVPGTLFLFFLAMSAMSRIFLEAFRGDSTLLSDSLRSAQLIAWTVLAVSLWALGRRIYSPSPEGAQHGGEL